MPPAGSYVALRVLRPFSTYLYNHCKTANIPVQTSTFEKRLHTTVIYSRIHAPDIKVDPITQHVATFAGYEMFTNAQGERNVLVVKLNAPTIVERHHYFMSTYKLAYDYPEFIPHVTLSYAYYDRIEGLPNINFGLILGEEYVEDLEL